MQKLSNLTFFSKSSPTQGKDIKFLIFQWFSGSFLKYTTCKSNDLCEFLGFGSDFEENYYINLEGRIFTASAVNCFTYGLCSIFVPRGTTEPLENQKFYVSSLGGAGFGKKC